MDSSIAKYRPYLQHLARRSIDDALRGKIDSSDLVQETLLNVGNRQAEFESLPEEERRRYLAQCLKNALGDQRRRYYGDKRDVGRERSINDIVDDASRELEDWIGASMASSPSDQAARHELQLDMITAIESLPEAQRRAFELKHFERLSLREVAGELKKTLPQVAGLLRRAKKTLRTALPELRI